MASVLVFRNSWTGHLAWGWDRRGDRTLESDYSTRLAHKTDWTLGWWKLYGWSVVVPRPGWRLYCLSAGNGPAEFRYVSLVLVHDMMI